MRTKAKAGIFPGCAPLGYRNAWDGGKKVIVVDEAMAPLVQEAFHLAAEGQLSLRKILEIMNQKGLRSRNGKLLNVSSLWSLLMNPFYTQWMRFQGELLRGTHPQLVDEELFQCVQQRLSRRR